MADAEGLGVSMVTRAALPPYPEMAEAIQAQLAEPATEAMLVQRGRRPDRR